MTLSHWTVPEETVNTTTGWLHIFHVSGRRSSLQSLPHPIRYYTAEHRDFNHSEFLWAIDVKTLVNEKVLHLLKYNTDMTIENYIIITDNVAQSWQGLNKDLQYL